MGAAALRDHRAALLAAPPATGELHEALTVLAAKTWRHPFTGLDVRFGVSTIERWLYAAKRAADPVRALPVIRCGVTSVASRVCRPRRLRHSPRNTAITRAGPRSCTTTTCASRSGPRASPVRRTPAYDATLKAQGLVRRRSPKRSTDGAIAARHRLEQREVRSYEVEHVLQLLHLDFHHGSRKVLTRSGAYVKPLLVGFIDDRSRFLCHAQWYTNEGSRELVHGLCQALQKVGLPRSLMTDNGSAMISGEFTAGLHHLGILHLPTLPYSPHVNGKQENLWGRVEGRLLAMLEGEENLTLEQLNLATKPGSPRNITAPFTVSCARHRCSASLAGPSVARECPAVTHYAMRSASRSSANNAAPTVR